MIVRKHTFASWFPMQERIIKNITENNNAICRKLISLLINRYRGTGIFTRKELAKNIGISMFRLNYLTREENINNAYYGSIVRSIKNKLIPLFKLHTINKNEIKNI